MQREPGKPRELNQQAAQQTSRQQAAQPGPSSHLTPPNPLSQSGPLPPSQLAAPGGYRPHATDVGQHLQFNLPQSQSGPFIGRYVGAGADGQHVFDTHSHGRLSVPESHILGYRPTVGGMHLPDPTQPDAGSAGNRRTSSLSSADDSDFVPNSEDERDDTAADRLERMRQRGEKRRDTLGRIPIGQYETPTGRTTLSGLFGQRIAQAQKANYGGQTFGKMPPYASLEGNIPNDGMNTLGYSGAPVPVLTDSENLATALATTLANGSEEDRAPGYGAYMRAMARHHVRTDGQGDDPLSEAMNPARTSASAARALMEGRTELSEQQIQALEEDSEPSSDSDDDYYLNR